MDNTAKRDVLINLKLVADPSNQTTANAVASQTDTIVVAGDKAYTKLQSIAEKTHSQIEEVHAASSDLQVKTEKFNTEVRIGYLEDLAERAIELEEKRAASTKAAEEKRQKSIEEANKKAVKTAEETAKKLKAAQETTIAGRQKAYKSAVAMIQGLADIADGAAKLGLVSEENSEKFAKNSRMVLESVKIFKGFTNVIWNGREALITERDTCEGWGNVPKSVTPNTTPLNVAVVITCHNYGRFLAECLESVLAQTYAPLEVIVVDDSSTDNTKDVASGYKNRGIEYLRVENKSSIKSRRDGVLKTTAEVVLFVDADDTLPPDFIECGVQEFTDKRVGVVYSDHRHFGGGSTLTNYTAYSQDRLFQGPNFVSTCSLIRREALLICDMWDRDIDIMRVPCDYIMYQSISLDGWDFKKQKAVLNYRRHSTQISANRPEVKKEVAYYSSHGLMYHTVTLFIPLAGRKWGWDRLSEYLDRQSWPHDQIKLILCDTSQDAEFSQMVRDWIAGSDYTDVRYFQLNAGIPGLADKERRENQVGVKYAVCRIYNKLRLMLETPYCWILEDDIIPPDNVLERLLKSFHHNIGAVTAPYQSRFSGMPVVWDSNNRHIKPQTGVTEVGGSGFGCVVIRQQLINEHMWPIQSDKQNLDPYFFSEIGDEWRVSCDWSCRSEHWEETRVFLI